jgi:hypothetical protein
VACAVDPAWKRMVLDRAATSFEPRQQAGSHVYLVLTGSSVPAFSQIWVSAWTDRDRTERYREIRMNRVVRQEVRASDISAQAILVRHGGGC